LFIYKKAQKNTKRNKYNKLPGPLSWRSAMAGRRYPEKHLE